eukprot:gene14525-17152_t
MDTRNIFSSIQPISLDLDQFNSQLDNEYGDIYDYSLLNTDESRLNITDNLDTRSEFIPLHSSAGAGGNGGRDTTYSAGSNHGGNNEDTSRVVDDSRYISGGRFAVRSPATGITNPSDLSTFERDEDIVHSAAPHYGSGRSSVSEYRRFNDSFTGQQHLSASQNYNNHHDSTINAPPTRTDHPLDFSPSMSLNSFNASNNNILMSDESFFNNQFNNFNPSPSASRATTMSAPDSLVYSPETPFDLSHSLASSAGTRHMTPQRDQQPIQREQPIQQQPTATVTESYDDNQPLTPSTYFGGRTSPLGTLSGNGTPPHFGDTLEHQTPIASRPLDDTSYRSEASSINPIYARSTMLNFSPQQTDLNGPTYAHLYDKLPTLQPTNQVASFTVSSLTDTSSTFRGQSQHQPQPEDDNNDNSRILEVASSMTFGDCEKDWTVLRTLDIINHNAHTVTIVTTAIHGVSRESFRVVIPEKFRDMALEVRPYASFPLNIEYAPKVSLVGRDHAAILSLICFEATDQGGTSPPNVIAVNLSGRCTQVLKATRDHLHTYNAYDLGECNPGQSLEARFNNIGLELSAIGKGFSVGHLPNNQVYVRYNAPESLATEGGVILVNPRTGHTKHVKLTANVVASSGNDDHDQQSPTREGQRSLFNERALVNKSDVGGPSLDILLPEDVLHHGLVLGSSNSSKFPIEYFGLGSLQVQCLVSHPNYFAASPTQFTLPSKQRQHIMVQRHTLGGPSVASLMITSPSTSDAINIPPTGFTVQYLDDAEYDQEPDHEEMIDMTNDDQSAGLKVFCDRNILSFGGVVLGQPETQQITLTSNSDKSLRLKASLASKKGDFNVHLDQTDMVLAPHSKSILTVSYKPLAAATYSNMLTVSSQDNGSCFSVPILGYGGRSEIRLESKLRPDKTGKPVLEVSNPIPLRGISGIQGDFYLTNHGTRAGFVLVIAEFPKATIQVEPKNVVLGVGETQRFIVRILSGNIDNVMNQFGLIKVFHGDDIARRRRRAAKRLASLPDETPSKSGHGPLSFGLFDTEFLNEANYPDQEDDARMHQNLDQSMKNDRHFAQHELDVFDENMSSLAIRPYAGDTSLLTNQFSSIKIDPPQHEEEVEEEVEQEIVQETRSDYSTVFKETSDFGMSAFDSKVSPTPSIYKAAIPAKSPHPSILKQSSRVNNTSSTIPPKSTITRPASPAQKQPVVQPTPQSAKSNNNSSFTNNINNNNESLFRNFTTTPVRGNNTRSAGSVGFNDLSSTIPPSTIKAPKTESKVTRGQPPTSSSFPRGYNNNSGSSTNGVNNNFNTLNHLSQSIFKQQPQQHNLFTSISHQEEEEEDQLQEEQHEHNLENEEEVEEYRGDETTVLLSEDEDPYHVSTSSFFNFNYPTPSSARPSTDSQDSQHNNIVHNNTTTTTTSNNNNNEISVLSSLYNQPQRSLRQGYQSEYIGGTNNTPQSTTASTTNQNLFAQHQEYPDDSLLSHEGDLLFASEEDVYFGNISPGERTMAKIGVSNASEMTLEVELSDLDAPFGLEHNTITLKPNLTTRIPILFFPTEEGTFSQTIRISNTDPDLPIYCDILLRGKSS